MTAGRVVAATVVCALLAGTGYLLAAHWLFPASGEAGERRLVRVPDLVGLSSDEASASLTSVGLELRERVRLAHPRAPVGAVVAQTPLPGQFARPGAPVEVTLSLGPERRVVPDLRGLTDRQARIVLERLGFRTTVDSSSSPVERGRVVGTRPGSGTEVTLPDEVTVVVSRGPRVSEVPELVGLHVDDVDAALEGLGLRVGEIQWDPEAFAAPGRIIGQSPEPGYALREGGRVSVRVAGTAPAGRETRPGEPEALPGEPEAPPGGSEGESGR